MLQFPDCADAGIDINVLPALFLARHGVLFDAYVVAPTIP